MLYPELTSQNLISDPFVDEDDTYYGNKVYKEGGIMQLNEDGELVFLGNFGHKVKMRGILFNYGRLKY